jgi:hypothetical protein
MVAWYDPRHAIPTAATTTLVLRSKDKNDRNDIEGRAKLL